MSHIPIAIEPADYWAQAVKKPLCASLLSQDNPRLYAQYMALNAAERQDAEDFAVLVAGMTAGER